MANFIDRSFFQEVARGTATLPKHLLPFPPENEFSVPNLTLQYCAQTLNAILQDLDLQWQYRAQLSTGVGFAKGNVWSRAARRKQHQSLTTIKGDEMDEGEDEDEDGSGLGFKISLKVSESGGVQVTIRWLKGRDSVLFESFCGMLKRQMTLT